MTREQDSPTGLDDDGPVNAGSTRRDVLRQGTMAGAGIGAAALLSACGSSGTSSPTTASTSPTSTSSAAPKKGGNLRVGLPDASTSETIDGLYPILENDFARSFNLYDHFMVLDPNTGEPVNHITEEVTPNKTATTWTIRLKDGIEFHNGKTAGAEDIIFTFQKVMNPKEYAPASALLAFIDLKSLKKVDSRTVRFNTTAPFFMPNALGRYELVLEPVGFDGKHPVGTGPFKYESFTPNQQSVMSAFDNYFLGRPHVDTLTMIDLQDDTARTNAILGGDVDLVAEVPYASAPAVKANSGVKVITVPTGIWYPMAMNCTVKPYSDARVRQALRLLANRPQMITATYLGNGRLGNDLYAIDDKLLYDHSIPQRVYDPEQAKSLLKAAGVSDFNFVLNAAPLGAGAVQMCQVFAEDAHSAGVNVTAKQIDLPTFNNNFTKWPFVNSQWFLNGYSAQVMLADGPKPAYAETHFGDTDAEFGKLATELQGTLDPAKRKELATQMQMIQHERGGYIIWSFASLVDAASTKVTGYTADPSGFSFAQYSMRTVSFT